MQTINIPDIYMSVLSYLSKEDKIKLATRLLNSATGEDKTAKSRLDIYTPFSGAWEDGKSANELAEELRTDRTFNRTVEGW